MIKFKIYRSGDNNNYVYIQAHKVSAVLDAVDDASPKDRMVVLHCDSGVFEVEGTITEVLAKLNPPQASERASVAPAK